MVLPVPNQKYHKRKRRKRKNPFGSMSSMGKGKSRRRRKKYTMIGGKFRVQGYPVRNSKGGIGPLAGLALTAATPIAAQIGKSIAGLFTKKKKKK